MESCHYDTFEGKRKAQVGQLPSRTAVTVSNISLFPRVSNPSSNWSKWNHQFSQYKKSAQYNALHSKVRGFVEWCISWCKHLWFVYWKKLAIWIQSNMLEVQQLSKESYTLCERKVGHRFCCHSIYFLNFSGVIRVWQIYQSVSRHSLVQFWLQYYIWQYYYYYYTFAR